MTTAIVGAEASGGAAIAAAAVQAQAKAAISTGTTPAAVEDTVKISADAQEVQQATAVQVRLLRNEGQSVPQIATQLKIAASAVQSYLGAQSAAQK
jgi:DNA-binding NarL/FixJ family response regulator